ncbi:MAG TPA: PTS-dependent dihydroxyacetone kinase phosphotransferase subunit DhaM [Thermoanaerobacterales bacterium]|nr:PTS-dependent dihydroxyacetone kinase phosphotransferase subunit DhaM [Thermoanaerobacterales bacterium]
MVGIVLVSHTPKIAEGTWELIRQMTGEKIILEIAAGTRDRRLGTDPVLIEEKIRKADTGDGVVVIVDLGSSIMSTEIAIESLEEPERSRAAIADAPFVEGAIAAAMEASFGKSMQDVKNAAENTRGMKKIA